MMRLGEILQAIEAKIPQEERPISMWLEWAPESSFPEDVAALKLSIKTGGKRPLLWQSMILSADMPLSESLATHIAAHLETLRQENTV